jgi:predicted dehydrogenase
VRELAYVDTVRENLSAFADAVSGRAAYPITSAEKLGNIAVMEAVVESVRTGYPARVATTLRSEVGP